MSAHSALAAMAITAVAFPVAFPAAFPAAAPVAPTEYTAPSGLHVTGDWTRSFQVRWKPETGAPRYVIEVRDPSRTLARGFTTIRDYANIGGLLPGTTYRLSVRTDAAGARSSSVVVRTARPESIGARIALYARTFAGHARYEYGGTGPRAFDCSGLTQYVYRHFGRVIPRTAEQQFRYFHPETSHQARPGDLIFFGGSSVSHVGIFEGGDMMVAAATPFEGIRYQRIYSDDIAFGTLFHQG
jgi:cell wall-associated NlpC family hydrolase